MEITARRLPAYANTLFAYLLHKGGDGAEAEDLADLLWPDSASGEAARNRLHHTVRFLRRALAPDANAKQEGHLWRDGSRYILAPPERSSLDISSFEQLCRQSIAHIQAASLDEALLRPLPNHQHKSREAGSFPGQCPP